MKLRFVVTEKMEKLVRGKDQNEKPIEEQVYDIDSFEGRITLAPMRQDGPSYFEEIELSLNDEAVYKTFKRGKVYLLSWEEE